MRRFVRWYGANPLHLLALAASFALTGYAVLRWNRTPVSYVYWVIGAAVGADLLLAPLYGIADASLVKRLRKGHQLDTAAVPWLNYWRFPAAISLILLLIWLPEITRLADPTYQNITTLSTNAFLYRWLAITGVLFAASAVLYAITLRRQGSRRRTDAEGTAG